MFLLVTDGYITWNLGGAASKHSNDGLLVLAYGMSTISGVDGGSDETIKLGSAACKPLKYF